MPSLVRYLFVFAALAFSIAFLLDRHLSHRFGGVRFEPVRAPLEISQGYILSMEFTVDYGCNYEVNLECRRVIPFDDLEKMLKSVDGNYTIYEDGIELCSFDFKDPWHGSKGSSSTLARMFPGFAASPNRNYRIDLKIDKTVSELHLTRPQLVIEIDGLVYKTEFYAPAMLPSLACLAIASLGVLFLLVGSAIQAYHWMKNRKTVLPDA